MVDIQTISIMIGAASVVVAMVAFIMNSRKEARLRQDQLIIQRFQHYGLDYARSVIELARAEFDDVEDFNEKYGFYKNPEFTTRYNYVFETYNLAGISLKRGADLDLIFQLYRVGSIINFWEKFEPMTKHWRERTNDPSFRKPFEYLYNEAKKRHIKIQQYTRR